LKNGVFNRTVPVTAHSTGPLVLSGRCENLDLDLGLGAILDDDEVPLLECKMTGVG
jgi:hypothetical protein